MRKSPKESEKIDGWKQSRHKTTPRSDQKKGKEAEDEEKAKKERQGISRLSQKSRKILSTATDESEFSAFPHESTGVARKLIIQKNYALQLHFYVIKM